jgi:hypothetical protein
LSQGFAGQTQHHVLVVLRRLADDAFYLQPLTHLSTSHELMEPE